jgi:pilus assembly protein Flp/PilA
VEAAMKYLRIFRDDAGATMVEYAVMLALIAAVCITVVVTLGDKTSSNFDTVKDRLNAL